MPRIEDAKVVDFGGDLDQDGNRLDKRLTRSLSSRAFYMGLEIVAGDNVWYKKCTWVYDPNCEDKWTIQKVGGLRDGVPSSTWSFSGGDDHAGDIPLPWSYEKETDCRLLPAW